MVQPRMLSPDAEEIILVLESYRFNCYTQRRPVAIIELAARNSGYIADLHSLKTGNFASPDH